MACLLLWSRSCCRRVHAGNRLGVELTGRAGGKVFRRVVMGGAVLVVLLGVVWWAGAYRGDSPSVPASPSGASVGVPGGGEIVRPVSEGPASPPQPVVPPDRRKQASAAEFSDALAQARVKAEKSPGPMPPGVSGWQGLSQAEAAKAFESAVNEHSRQATANPFEPAPAGR